MQNADYKWRTLPNPFFYSDTKVSSGIIGRVSGRIKDIMNIIYNDQNAIILSGAPRIGKTALLQYLQTSLQPQGYSWRKEEGLDSLIDEETVEATHFVQIDLTPLENIYQNATQKVVYTSFLQQCGEALQKVYQLEKPGSFADLRGLREFLRRIEQERQDERCFVILDNIDRLGMDAPAFFLDNVNAKNPQEQGISLLDDSGVIRALTGLVEEFRRFGVILALESLPRARVDAQFTQVSADLAHFATTTLQIFTREDTQAFLGQKPARLDSKWAPHFAKLSSGDVIFSPTEQAWIYEQAGSHPYILQQFCLHTFHFKQLRAEQYKRWQELEEEDMIALVEYVKGQIITFLSSMWKRLQEALNMVSSDTRDKFFRFITSLADKRSGTTISTQRWNELGSEIQYILYNEGIVRYDPFQPVYMPGELLKNYLLQRVAEMEAVKTRTPRLVIKFPDAPGEPIVLSDLEYRLVKALLQCPKRCPESDLVKAGWNKIIDSKTFTQRMYQLRKKLKGNSGIDIIQNHYGGFYSLAHPEWLQFLDQGF